MSLPRYRPALTLIELLVVIAIVAILSTVLLPTIQEMRHRGTKSKAVSDLRQVGVAILQYSVEQSEGRAPGAAPLGITAEYMRTNETSSGRTLAAAVAPYLDSMKAHEVQSGVQKVLPQLICPGFEKQFPNPGRYNTPHYVQNYTLTTRTEGELSNPRVLGEQNTPDQRPPIRMNELDSYGGPSRVWVLTNLDMRLPTDHPQMRSNHVTSSGWFNSARIPSAPVWGDSRMRLYFDGHVAFVPFDAPP